MPEATVHICHECKHHKTELTLTRHLDICKAVKATVNLINGQHIFPQCSEVRAMQDYSKTCQRYEPKEGTTK